MYDNTGGYPILYHQIIILPPRLQLNPVSLFHGQVTTLKHHLNHSCWLNPTFFKLKSASLTLRS